MTDRAGPGDGRVLRVAGVLALCVIGVVVAILLLRPGHHDTPLPAVAAVRFDSDPLSAALTRQADDLRAVAAVGSGQLDTLLAQDPLDLSIPQVTADGVTARDVTIQRHGSDATVEATVDPAQLAELAPAEVSGLKLDADASRDGELVLDGQAKALGFSVPVTVRVHADDAGAVVAEPEGLPIGSTVLFSDPRIHVQSLEATPQADGTLRVRVTATITG